MKFFVQLKLKPGTKEKVLEAFELRGPNRNPGVTLLGAWIGKNDDVIFVLVESTDEAHLLDAAKSWSAFGDYKITPVMAYDEY